MHEPPGFDVGNVSAWLAAHVDGLALPLRWTKLAGGHSNVTYRIDDESGRTFVVRRPPLGELQPTAHDMGREFKVIDALWPTSVPVPEPIAFCDDPEVIGARFYAMGWVEGRSLYTALDVEEHLTVAARAGTSTSFIDTLAELHALDPDEIGLGSFGKRDSYVGRQLHRWYSSWNASKDRELPDVDRLHDFLVERLPEQTTVSLVHGDYGLHNCRVAKQGHIAAVVDWEISTLGDPLADLAYCINAWSEPGDITPGGTVPPTALPGFCSRQDLLDRYSERTNADLGQIEYYRCFNYWKVVCILQGVYARYAHGQKDTEGVDMGDFGRRMMQSLELAVEAAERLAG